MLKGKFASTQPFIFLLIFFYPISTNLGAGIRFLDLVMCFTVLVTFVFFQNKLSRDTIIIIAIITFYLAVCSLLNLAIGRPPTTNGFILSAKMLINGLFLIQAANSIKKLNDKQLKNVISFFRLVGGGLSIWALYSFIMNPLVRVGFPFSNEFPDSHALGSFLSLYFTFLVLIQYFYENKLKIYSIILLTITFLAIFTTGSRSFMLIIPLLFIILFTRNVIAGNSIKILTSCLIVTIIIVFVFSTEIDVIANDIRSLTFDLAHASEAKRLRRIVEVIAELDTTLNMFGRGLLHVNYLYFDGTITFILYNFALPGVLLFLTVLGRNLYIFIKYGTRENLFLFLVLASLVVSEFFLLSRWLVPVTICYLILQELRIRRIKIK